MAEAKQIDIKRLASLLDDPDENVAISAMAELLNREFELGELPGTLQENANPLMRRRIHQLQSALTMIRRRRELAELLRQEEFDFANALIRIHLQWFDRDSETVLNKKLQNFCAQLSKHPCDNLSSIGDAFASFGIVPCPVTTLKVEQYCLGAMLDDRCGASPLWCGLICSLFSNLGFYTVLYEGRFAVADENELLIPENNWQCIPLPAGTLEMWSPGKLLHLAVMTLFSAAVNSDSFRYILTLAQAITGEEMQVPLSTLPYPYNPELNSQP